MEKVDRNALSRRERQVMDALYRRKEGTVAELVEEIPEDVSYSAVRAVLKTLRDKGKVGFRETGRRYVYFPSVPREKARWRALDHVVRTFFDDSPEAAAVALLAMSDLELDDAQLGRIERLVASAKEEGR